MGNFTGKTILVSGASSGIGKACVKNFAAQGAKLILCARSLEKMQEIAEKLKDEFGTESKVLQVDVRNRTEVEAAINSLPDEWTKIDILVNNAGGALGLEKLHEGDPSDWDAMIDTNIKGLLYLTRLIVPMMLKQGLKGHVVNIGSIAGIAAYPNGAVYCATKAAVRCLSDGLRMDLVDKPIRVTNIQPGMTETNFSKVRFHGDEQRAAAVYSGITPLTASDIADIVTYVTSAPAHVQICEVTVTPTNQATGGVIYKKQ
ncbi:MAG: SDR family NAD(P)-dependent oxidoreductase [Acholeplasmataceae bacterium]|nr:SDR family NAD(P)-dependent oxidoreductase [Acidaminococcaceae bacterium]NLY84148.1 SDR family NAD(P)-dependent oxidoreductase [Acholeplasmataceae bacterium]